MEEIINGGVEFISLPAFEDEGSFTGPELESEVNGRRKINSSPIRKLNSFFLKAKAEVSSF